MNTEKVRNTVLHFFKNTIPKILNIIKNFFVNSFEFTSTKKSRITGLSIAGVLLLIVVFFNNQFLKLETSAKWLLLLFALVAPFIIGAFIAFSTKIKNDLLNKIWHFVFFMLSPIITMTMTECLNNIFIYDMTYLGFLANYMVILLLQFLFFAVSGSFRLSQIATNAICYGFALAHCYVVQFRGTPFIPMDFFAITPRQMLQTPTITLPHTP